MGQIIINIIPRKKLHISYILIIKFIGKLVILSADLEIAIDIDQTVTHQTLTDRDAVLSAGTFLPSDIITDGEL